MNIEIKNALAAHRKWGVWEYAKGIGNNRKACLVFGAPKLSLYE